MKSILLIAVAVFTFASSGLFAHLYNRTDDLALRYILWKKNLHPYPSDIIAHAVISDPDRNELIRGKTKDEVRRLFPGVSELSLCDYHRMYEKELAGRDYLWLDTGGVIIFFKDGKATEISIMKG